MIILKNISKKFGNHTALNSISLTIGEGEIHGIAGANGSGKSTLLNILFGNPVIRNTGGYSGDIFIHGRKAVIHIPKSSSDYGIGMIHQEFALIPDMSADENIALCREKTYALTEKIFGKNFALIDRRRTREAANHIMESLGIHIESNLRVAHLPVNLKQFIAIAREISKENLSLLMLDEPTSALNRNDSEMLLNTVKKLSQKCCSVLYVSHRIEEMMNICDAITVLRDGKNIAQYHKKDEFDLDTISTAIVGERTVKAVRKASQRGSHPVMTFKNFSVNMPHEQISDLTMEIFRGEILGVTSLSGHGKSALGYGVTGFYETGGQVILENEKLDIADSRNTLSKGILFIPEDRREKGLLLSQSVMKNMVFTALQTSDNYYLHRFPLPFLSLIHHKNCRKYAEDSVEKFGINCRSVHQKTGELSGGNQQKVCIARACAVNPEILFISEPTRGVDIRAKEIILETLLDISENFGATVIISSGEIEELKRVCDRIAVLYKGKLFAVLSPEHSDKVFFQAMSGMA